MFIEDVKLITEFTGNIHRHQDTTFTTTGTNLNERPASFSTLIDACRHLLPLFSRIDLVGSVSHPNRIVSIECEVFD